MNEESQRIFMHAECATLSKILRQAGGDIGGTPIGQLKLQPVAPVIIQAAKDGELLARF